MENHANLLIKNNRQNRINKVLQAIIVIIDILLLGIFFKSGFEIFSLIFFIGIIFISSYGNILFLKKRRLDSYDVLGKYTSDEVKEIISEVFRTINKKEKPNIYIISLNSVNAFITDSIFKMIPQLNALYLTEDLFNHLKTDELKAVIYHELGHYYHFMNPFSKNILPLDIFTALFPFFIFLISGFKSIFSLFFLVFFFSALTRFLVFRNIQDNEYLSDHFSMEKNGLLNMINALIVVSKINEIDSKIAKYLIERIMRDKTRLSFKDFDFYYNTLTKEIPYEFQNFREISTLIDKFLYNGVEGDIPDINTENYNYEEIKGWETFDLNHDFRISKDEYPLFIESLMKNDLKDGENENYEERYDIDHPSLKNRILFLEDNREGMDNL